MNRCETAYSWIETEKRMMNIVDVVFLANLFEIDLNKILLK